MKRIYNRKEALKAVKQDGHALIFLSDELRNDREIALEVVEETHYQPIEKPKPPIY